MRRIMKRVNTVIVLASLSLLASACGNVSTADGGAPEVSFLTPTAESWSNGVVDFEIDVQGPADRVELWANGEKLASFSQPYSYLWDTNGAAEGDYEIVARAVHMGHAAETAPVKVHVDRTAPVIAGHTPESGATNVSIRDSITVRFSEPMDADSLEGNVTLAAGAHELSRALMLSPDGMTLTVSPLESPSLPESLSLALGALRDKAGNDLGGASWSWTAPYWYAYGHAAGEHGVIALDRMGAPMIAFAADGAIQVARWNLDTHAWDALAGAGEGLEPEIGLDALTQQPIVAFLIQDGTRQTVAVREFDGETWTDLGHVAIGATGDVKGFSMAVDPNGNPVLALRQDGGTNVDLFVTRYSRQHHYWQTLGSRALELDGTHPVDQAHVTLDPTGFLPYVAWGELDGAADTLHAAKWNVSTKSWDLLGGSFEAAAGVANDSVTIVAGNAPIVAWHEGSAIHSAVLAGGAWSPLGSSIDGDSVAMMLAASGPSLVVTSGGVATLHRHTDAGGWVADPIALASGVTGARVVADPTGNPVLALDAAGSVLTERLNHY